MYLIYTILLILSGLLWLPGCVWRRLRDPLSFHDVHARFGLQATHHAGLQHAAGCIWFHAASVGEVQGLRPIIAAVHARFPALPVVLSTFTPSGKMLAQRLVPEAAAVLLLPFDFPWIMRRLVCRLRPRALIVQETELWPHLFRAARRQQVPVAVVNGRLSPRAFANYQWIRPLIRQVLAAVTLLLAQSEEGARRFRYLGAPTRCVHVVGNTNIDRALHMAAQPFPPHPVAPLVQGKRLLIAGSTHEGEETVLLAVYRRLRICYPDLLLLLAPRHLERLAAVIRHVQAYRYHAVLRSQCNTLAPGALEGTSVLVLDTLGELPSLYRLCTVAFVGGSLVPIGGHNILEPAVFAKPLFFGPYMQHYPELVALLCNTGGAIQVQGEAELYARLAHILARPEEGQAMGARALRALVTNRGALDRVIAALTQLLNEEPSPAMEPKTP